MVKEIVRERIGSVGAKTSRINKRKRKKEKLLDKGALGRIIRIAVDNKTIRIDRHREDKTSVEPKFDQIETHQIKRIETVQTERIKEDVSKFNPKEIIKRVVILEDVIKFDLSANKRRGGIPVESKAKDARGRISTIDVNMKREKIGGERKYGVQIAETIREE